jgi:drug/metabolite transporter (DMT)-like permease
MIACGILSSLVAGSRLVKIQPLKSQKQFLKVAALAIIFSITVVLGNMSLRYIPVSFNQAIGATTPVFTAAISLLMLKQKESGQVYMALIPVVMGIIIASGAEPMFNVVGFSAAITATAARAFKSVLQGVMLSDPSERLDSLSLLMYMAPIAAVALLPATMYFEPAAYSVALQLGSNGQFWILLAVNSLLAYFVNLRHTCALTLQVLGNAKGVVAVGLSVAVFRNPVTFLSMLGYAVTICGVVMYSRAKMLSRRLPMLSVQSRRGSPLGSVDLDSNGKLLSILERTSSDFGFDDTSLLLKAARPDGKLSKIPLVGSNSFNNLLAAEKAMAKGFSRALSGLLTRGYSNIYEAA